MWKLHELVAQADSLRPIFNLIVNWSQATSLGYQRATRSHSSMSRKVSSFSRAGGNASG